MKTSLGLKIQNLIEENNLSIQGLEKKAGLKINAVRNIISGQSKNPQANTLLAVSRALGCSISDLLDEETPSSKKVDLMDYENLDLLEKTFLFTIRFYKEKEESLDTKRLLDSAHQLYKYCLENNDGEFDPKFSKWFLQKEINSL